MPRPRPRQTRLDTGDPQDALTARWANYRVLRRSFLSATALASFSHCNVKPFIERITSALGLDAETYEMRQGILAHEQVQGALGKHAPAVETPLRDALAQGQFAFATEYPLKDDRRMLRGIADLVYTQGGQSFIVELKNTRGPHVVDARWAAKVWFEHGLQLHLYGLLAERELGQVPRLALAYLKDAPRADLLAELEQTGDAPAALAGLVQASVRLETTREARAILNQHIRDFRRTEKQSAIPLPSHDDPRRCAGCRVRRWCPRRLDQLGRFEPLDAGLLEGPA